MAIVQAMRTLPADGPVRRSVWLPPGETKVVKKKTVITTEKHEVWVIRQAGETFAEENTKDQESADTDPLLPALPEFDPNKDEPEAQKNHSEITQ